MLHLRDGARARNHGLMLRRRPLLSLFLLATAAQTAPAQAQESDGQVWTTTTANVPVSADLSFGTHIIARLSDEADGIYQLQFGADLEFDAGSDVKVAAGYSYVPSYDQGSLTTREHRIRQQVSADLASLAGGTLAGRLRLEQRWRDDGDDLKLRLRPRLTWTRPLGPDDLALRLGHESFYNLNTTDWGGEARYDRMRNSIALRRRFGPVVMAEAGYLNQYTFSHEGADEVAHALTLALTFDF